MRIEQIDGERTMQWGLRRVNLRARGGPRLLPSVINKNYLVGQHQLVDPDSHRVLLNHYLPLRRSGPTIRQPSMARNAPALDTGHRHASNTVYAVGSIS